MFECTEVQCPYCLEWQELELDPDTTGHFVQDCSVCCQPWDVSVEWREGTPIVILERSQ